MRAPAGFLFLSARRPVAAALSLLSLAVLAAGESRTDISQVLKSTLPQYDRTIRENALAAKTAEQPREVPATIAVPLPADPPPTASGTSGDNVVVLPKITVRAQPDLPKRLPRVTAPKPWRDLKGEPFESLGARDARLVKKHLSPLVRALNSKKALVALAREAEAIEQKSAQLNALAGGIEVDETIGRDPAQIKKLRDEYEKLYYRGPK